MVKPSSIQTQMKFDFEKNHTQIISFAESFRPIYYFARFCGQLPFSIVRSSTDELRRPRVSKCDALWFILSIFLYVAVSYRTCQILSFEINANKTDHVLFLGNATLHIITMAFGILKLTMDMYNRHRLVYILNRFIQFDQEIVSMGVDLSFKSDIRQAYLFSISTIIIVALLNAVSYFTTKHHPMCSHKFHPSVEFVAVLEFCRCLVPICPAIIFIFLLQNLYKRFVALNLFLKNRFFNGDSLKLTTDIRKDDSISGAKFAGRQHSQLVGIMDDINFCYSFQIMINTANTFLLTVLTCYTFYHYIVHQNPLFQLFTFINLRRQLVYLISTLFILYTTHLIKREGKTALQTIHDIVNGCSDPDVAYSLTQLSLQLQFRNPVATCGLFRFDWSILYTMCAATASYLTILLSFESSD